MKIEDTVNVRIPRTVYDRVIRPLLDLMNPAQEETAARVLAMLDDDVSSLLARLIDLKPANQRAPWAAVLVRLILDRLKATGSAADSLREQIRSQINELDEASLNRILGKRPGHTSKKSPVQRPPTAPPPSETESLNIVPALVFAP